MVETLTDFRSRIDNLDDEIVCLLAKRFAVVRQVANVKRTKNIPAVLPDRIEYVIMRATKHAESLDLDPDFVRKLYKCIVDEACGIEEEIIASS